MSRLYLSKPCAFFRYPLHTVLAGAVGARPSLRPPFKEGQRIGTPRAKTSRGNESACFFVIAKKRSSEKSGKDQAAVRTVNMPCPYTSGRLARLRGQPNEQEHT